MTYNITHRYFWLKKWQKLLQCRSFSHIFNKKYWHIWDMYFWKFNETLTNDIVVLNNWAQIFLLEILHQMQHLEFDFHTCNKYLVHVEHRSLRLWLRYLLGIPISYLTKGWWNCPSQMWLKVTKLLLCSDSLNDISSASQLKVSIVWGIMYPSMKRKSQKKKTRKLCL